MYHFSMAVSVFHLLQIAAYLVVLGLTISITLLYRLWLINRRQRLEQSRRERQNARIETTWERIKALESWCDTANVERTELTVKTVYLQAEIKLLKGVIETTEAQNAKLTAECKRLRSELKGLRAEKKAPHN